MDVKVRLLRRTDIAQVVSGWNISLPYDRITEERFERTIFDDANYENEGNLVATRNHKIVGFVATVAREGIAGRNGAGRIQEKDLGYIKGLYVLKECDEEGIKRCLLERALGFRSQRARKWQESGNTQVGISSREWTQGMKKS